MESDDIERKVLLRREGFTSSADKASLLGSITIFGKRFFDLFDYISSNILLPLGGLLIILFIGWFTKKESI